jgi:hypothetical protein
MAHGESQDWSWVASGWASKSFLVHFLYASSMPLMISWKLDDEAAEM